MVASVSKANIIWKSQVCGNLRRENVLWDREKRGMARLIRATLSNLGKKKRLELG